METLTVSALEIVLAERDRQEQLKDAGRFQFTLADKEMPLEARLASLGEEFGEVCRQALTQPGAAFAFDTSGSPDDLVKELSHVAAVAVAWMECLMAE